MGKPQRLGHRGTGCLLEAGFLRFPVFSFLLQSRQQPDVSLPTLSRCLTNQVAGSFFCFLIHSPLIKRSEILFERLLLLVAICCRISKEFSKSTWATKGTSLHASSNCEMYLVFILRVGFVHVRHRGSSFSVGTCVCGSRSSSFLVSTAA